MGEQKLSPPEPMGPLQVTVIGTGDGKMIDTGTVGKTPSGEPNLIVTVVSPIVAILVRFVNAYLTMLVALVGAGMTTDVIPATDFINLVSACAKLSLAGAGLGALKDVVTIVGKLEHKFPLATGSV